MISCIMFHWKKWQAPVPIMRKWTEPLKVHDFADFCIPWSNNGATNPGTASKTSEDCLYVNIYVPGLWSLLG